jgi:uncharacterized protein
MTRAAFAAALLIAAAAADAAVTHDVTIATPDPVIRLSGTLALPDGAGPHPAVILLHGQGPHTRDQVISGSPMFRQIADGLVASGIAVLRYDKRGFGASTGPAGENATTPAELAQDARAALAFLLARREIDAAAVGLVGHSEGAMVAPLVAAVDPAVRFLVLLAPPAVSGEELWIRPKLRNLAAHGVQPDRLGAVEAQMRRLIAFIARGGTDDETYYAIGHDFVAAHGMEPEKIDRKLIDNLLSDVRTPWFRYFFTHDNADALKKVTVPVLSVTGSADEQVPVEQNVAPAAAALVAAGNADFTVTVMPDQDHFFFVRDGRRLAKHERGRMEVNPRLLELAGRWILSRARQK